ncbi:MAG TPA: replication-associated recombination protein A, partial [Gemmatimonadota bacterium]|nr:replication-associated recombination protein A [Gemmatimonadota bacterium]
RNAPTRLMKDLGYGAGYRYDHDEADAIAGQEYMPDSIGPRQFYEPTSRGFEAEIAKRLQYWAEKRREKKER